MFEELDVHPGLSFPTRGTIDGLSVCWDTGLEEEQCALCVAALLALLL